jgi:hypothetical protein
VAAHPPESGLAARRNVVSGERVNVCIVYQAGVCEALENSIRLGRLHEILVQRLLGYVRFLVVLHLPALRIGAQISPPSQMDSRISISAPEWKYPASSSAVFEDKASYTDDSSSISFLARDTCHSSVDKYINVVDAGPNCTRTALLVKSQLRSVTDLECGIISRSIFSLGLPGGLLEKLFSSERGSE